MILGDAWASSVLAWHFTELDRTEQQLNKISDLCIKREKLSKQSQNTQTFLLKSTYKTLGDTETNEFYSQRLSSGCINQFRLHSLFPKHFVGQTKNLPSLCLNMPPRKGGTHAQKTSETLRTSVPSETNVEDVFYTQFFLRNSHRAILFFPPARRKQIVTEFPFSL